MSVPAWSRVCSRNMRGETVRFNDVNWEIQTHLRNGIWRAVRYAQNGVVIFAYVKLNFRGQPTGHAHVFPAVFRWKP